MSFSISNLSPIYLNKAGSTSKSYGTRRRRLEQTAVNGAKRTQQSIRRIGVPRDTSEDTMSSEQQRSSIEQTSFFLVFSVLLMAIFGIILFVGYGRRRADCTKRVGQSSLGADSLSHDSHESDTDLESGTATPTTPSSSGSNQPQPVVSALSLSTLGKNSLGPLASAAVFTA